MKLEFLQPGHSHKARAANAIVSAFASNATMVERQRTAFFEITGGNFGVALTHFANRFGIRTFLASAPVHGKHKRELLKRLGATLLCDEMFLQGSSSKEVASEAIKQIEAAGYMPFRTRQFDNPLCVQAHEKVAEEQLVVQLEQLGVLSQSSVVFVTGCGSGAHLQGYSNGLRRHYTNLEIALAEPFGCNISKDIFRDGHGYTGLSIGRRVPFYRPVDHEHHLQISDKEATEAQERLLRNEGLFVGNSTALTYAAALKIQSDSKGCVICLAYDGGDSYMSDRLYSD